MPKIIIDTKKCKVCKLCIQYCPQRSIILSDKLNKQGTKTAIFKKGSKCTGCGFCAIMCPDAAIEVYR